MTPKPALPSPLSSVRRTVAHGTVAAALLGLAVTFGAIADEALPDDATPEQVTQRILELQQEIEALLARLPAAERHELKQRLRQSLPAGSPPADAPAVANSRPAAEEPNAPKSTTPAPAATLEEARIAAGVAPPPPLAAQPALPVLKRRPQSVACTTLVPLDENGDGRLTAADRYWRHLYLWSDKNGDGQMQEKEIESAYARGVREIATSLDTFIRSKGSLGEMRIEQYIVLDLRGDGFSQRSRRDDGVLVVQASALARGTGPELLDEQGRELADFQRFRKGLSLRFADASVTALSCP